MDAINPDHAQDATREKLLAAAHRQFAARGYFGASIAQIAGEVGLTKQALLYHFRRKEDLYTQVLKGIANRMLTDMRAGIDPSKPAAEQFEELVLGIYASAQSNPLDVKVLMRELLDDQRRDAPPSEWFFRTFIDEVVEVLDRIEGMDALPRSEKVARVYFILSAIEYFSGSTSVLTRFYGEDEYRNVAHAFPDQLRAAVHHLIKP